MDVTPVADARRGLSGILRAFRSDPDAPPVVIGSHRKPEAVIVPFQAYRREGAEVITMERLRELAPLIRRLASASHLDGVRVYGSVSRGDQRPGSDLDLMATPRSGASLFDLAQFEMDLEALLRVPVSVVSSRSLDPNRDARAIAESVPL